MKKTTIFWIFVVIGLYLLSCLVTWGVVNLVIVYLLPHFNITFEPISFFHAFIITIVLFLVNANFEKIRMNIS